jgi:cytochrome c5
MKRSTLYYLILLVAVIIAIGAAVGVQGATTDQPAKPGPSATPSKSHQDQEDRGEAIFMTNCVRCHMPPSSIPPRITGTIVMHMRTRAKLSAADEKALLHFLAP